ncbi:hypothetical protein FKM82_008191 [Ascaphus truei]
MCRKIKALDILCPTENKTTRETEVMRRKIAGLNFVRHFFCSLICKYCWYKDPIQSVIVSLKYFVKGGFLIDINFQDVSCLLLIV